MSIPLPLAAEIETAVVTARLTGRTVAVIVPPELVGLDLSGLKAAPGKVELVGEPRKGGKV